MMICSRHAADLGASLHCLPERAAQGCDLDHNASAIIGTGSTFTFPEPQLLAPLRNAGIGVEVMDTPAACRTYNILLGEGRNVVAALIVTPAQAGAQ